jgi:hypothetical protein
MLSSILTYQIQMLAMYKLLFRAKFLIVQIQTFYSEKAACI